MKRLTLVKTTNNPNVAHLYEHIFCYALNKFFRNHNLFSYVDYHYDAKTYSEGFIHLNILLFTQESEVLADELGKLELSLDNESISIAIFEIMAEKKIVLYPNFDKLEKLLLQIDAQPWQPIADLAIHSPSSNERTSAVLEKGDTKTSDFKTMRIVASLKKNDEERYTQALFIILSNALLNNITDTLADRFACFGYAQTVANDDSNIKLTREYRVYAKIARTHTEYISACEDVIASMLEYGVKHKLAQYLQNSSYSVAFNAPDELAIYEDTGLLIGGEGWRQLVSDGKYMKYALDNLEIAMSLGGKTSPIQIGSDLTK